MSLHVVFKKGHFELPNNWVSTKEAAEEFSDEELIELFQEDLPAFLDDIGGLSNIIDSVYWEDDDPRDGCSYCGSRGHASNRCPVDEAGL